MLLRELGEFGFINRISEKFKSIVIPETTGIGDDCAIIRKDENFDYVVTTDMLVENIHFIRSKITPFELGYKTLAVNLSDVAAMGGNPFGSFLSVAIPADIELEYLDDFIAGYKHLSEKHNVTLLGGDTTRSEKHIALNVTVIGIIEKNRARLRSMAKEGDIICVTGFLGDSDGGLKILLENLPISENEKYLIKRHNNPVPYVNEGIWLASQNGVNAMIDVSDGITSDLKHILNASQKSAVIEIDNLPISQQLEAVYKKYGFDVIKSATSGGEDYKLILTIDKNRFSKIAEDYKTKFGNELFEIGTVKKGNIGEICWLKQGEKFNGLHEGFNHFRCS